MEDKVRSTTGADTAAIAFALLAEGPEGLVGDAAAGVLPLSLEKKDDADDRFVLLAVASELLEELPLVSPTLSLSSSSSSTCS